MGHLSASRAGLNLLLKRVMGMPYRARIAAARAYSASDFWASQRESLVRAYTEAKSFVPYYRDRPVAYPNLDPREPLIDILAKLPVLSKATLRAHNRDFWRSPLPRFNRVHRTSGTSGTPLELAATLQERAFGEAVFEDWLLSICGVRGPRAIFVSGFMTPGQGARQHYWLDCVTGSAYLSIYSLTERNRDAIVRLINRLNPLRIGGYASAIYQLAELVGDRVAATRNLRAATSTSEVLLPEWRSAIEQNLCGCVYDHYSSQEAIHFVPQCREGRLHIHPLIGVVEIVRDDGTPAQAGEIGRVLVSTTFKRTMPLFRYELGDRALSTGYATDCPCGLHWPTIGQIEGRSEDLVRTRDGRRIGLLGHSLTKNLANVRESQIVQNDFEHFTFNVVRADGSRDPLPQLEATVTADLAKRLQFVPQVRFAYLSEIPRGARGKFKAVVVGDF